MMKHFAILGYPLGHSLSQPLHTFLSEEIGEEISYDVFEITPEKLDERTDELFKLNGFNITIPYKVRIMEELDELDQNAKNHGAVNTVAVYADGKRVGYNTDCIGFIKSMEQNGVFVSGRVCVLGAGGVGRMFATECALRGCEVVIAVRQRSMQEARKVAEHIRDISQAKISVADIDKLSEQNKERFELLINATPVGMYPKTEYSPLSEDVLKQVGTVFDCIYNPKKTKLMQQAEKAGCKVVGGLGMLVWQAVAAQQIWFDTQFTEEQVNRVIAKMQNLL